MTLTARWKGGKGEGHGEVEDRDSVLGFGRKRVEIGDERGGEMSIRGRGKLAKGLLGATSLKFCVREAAR